MARRTIVYVDGFNLYYGAVRGGPYKWLDLERYFRLLRKDDELRRICYFTALLDGPRRSSQATYLRTLEQRPLIEIVLGKFKEKQIRCRVEQCKFTGSRMFTQTEEKRTDVNIAVRMLDDAYQDCCDLFVLVSGDSDLVPAIHAVKARFPKKQVLVYVPSRNPVRGAAVELRSAADRHRDLPLAPLKHAQFPARVPDGAGGFIEKPSGW